MLRIALTGGIGSGKTSASDHFAELGAGVIDTDVIAHELTAPGAAALPRLAALFGDRILRQDDSLDRAMLRSIVFSDPQARARLEGILHPMIRATTLERLGTLHTPYAILVIPLLFEVGQQTLVDRVLVVDAPEPLQITRVQQRSNLEVQEIRRIIDSQIPRQERLARADDILDNTSGQQDLYLQVERLHRDYLRLSREYRPSCAGG